MSSSAYDIDDARFRIRPYQQIVASCSGAFITSITMTPLDVIKTRLQVQQKTMLSEKCFVYCNGLMDHLCPCYPTSTTNGGATSAGSVVIPPNKPVYNGTIDAMLKISRHEGVRSLWSGLGPTLILALPATVIYFVLYEQLRVRLKDQYFKAYPDPSTQYPPFFIPLAAGMGARVCSVTVVNPMELVRTKMQSQRMSYFEVGNALRTMIATQGYGGLWRGLGPTLYRDVPFSGIYWTTYEGIKKMWDVQQSPGFGASFVAGAVSGCIAAFLTTPFDVIKTHKQIEFGERFLYPDATSNVRPERNTRQLIRHIYQTNGVNGLFAGLTPRLFKISPACAIMIASFEYGKSFFHDYNVRKYHHHQQQQQTDAAGAVTLPSAESDLQDELSRNLVTTYGFSLATHVQSSDK